MSEMYCKKCGSELTDKAYCPYCGTDIVAHRKAPGKQKTLDETLITIANSHNNGETAPSANHIPDENSRGRSSENMQDREHLNEQLKELAETPVEDTLEPGAMCYMPEPSRQMEKWLRKTERQYLRKEKKIKNREKRKKK